MKDGCLSESKARKKESWKEWSRSHCVLARLAHVHSISFSFFLSALTRGSLSILKWRIGPMAGCKRTRISSPCDPESTEKIYKKVTRRPKKDRHSPEKGRLAEIGGAPAQ